HFDDIDSGRFTNVIGLSLEGQAEDADTFAAEGPEGGADLIEETPLLLAIDLFDFGEEAEVDAQLLGYRTEGGDVFWEAGATVANPWPQEFGADAAIEAHAARHLLDIGVGGLAEIGDGVDERDLHRKEGVGGMLDDLGALRGGHQKGRWLVDVAEAGDGAVSLVVGAGGEGKVDPGQ